MDSQINGIAHRVSANPPPSVLTGGRQLVPVLPPGLPEPTTPPQRPSRSQTTIGETTVSQEADREATGGLDMRNASPRQIYNISLDLYVAGLLSYEDYTALAFQPELQPDYDRTVDALTGERAAPDRRRDFVKYWSDRLQFELRHNAGDSPVVRQTRRIHELLKSLGQPTQLNV